jgi:hypothetical protein
VPEQRSLPSGFESLEALVPAWVLPDTRARIRKRQTSTIEEVRAFYETMLPEAESAVAYLRNYPLGALPNEGERLLKLMLALAEIAPAVEWYDDPQVYDGFDMNRVATVRQIPDLDPQY